MLIAVFYQIILVLGYYTFLGGLKIVDDVPDLSGVDTKFSGCRADGEFIFDDGH